MATFPKILTFLFRSILRMCKQNLKFVALPVRETIAIEVFLWGELQTPILRKRMSYGWRMVLFVRALVSSYRPSIVTFHLSLRVSEILPLLFSSKPLFPTPPIVCPNFSYVPLGVRGWPLGCEEQRCWA